MAVRRAQEDEAVIPAEVSDWVRNRDHAKFNVVACQGNEPSEADVREFEATCGFKLPGEFRAFLMSPLGGLYAEAREEIWPRTEAYAVGPFWSFLRGVMVFGIAKDIPEWLDIRVQYAQMRDEGYGHLVPFLQLETDPDPFCFTREGAIVQWSHEEPDEPRPEDSAFGQLLARELNELQKRTEQRIRGEHL